MFGSSEELFAALENDLEGVLGAVQKRYDVHPDFARRYLEHLQHDHRQNPRAHAYFEAEFGLFHRTLEHFEELQKSFRFRVRGREVLDVGCNSGHSLRAFERLGASRVVGVEYAHARVKTCEESLRLHGSRALVVEGSILEPDIGARARAPFDLLTCFDVLEHLPSAEDACSAFAALLRPGGLLVLTVGNPHHPEMMLREPHYGLPGMTLLPPERARRYHALARGGPYEVNAWFTRTELQAMLEGRGFDLDPVRPPEVPRVRDEVRSALAELRSSDYPDARVRDDVLDEVARVEALLDSVEDPEDFFGAPLFTMVAYLRRAPPSPSVPSTVGAGQGA